MLEELLSTGPETRSDCIEQIQRFRAPREGWSEAISAPTVWLGDMAAETAAGATAARYITDVLGVFSDVAAWSIDLDGVCAAFRDRGHDVDTIADIHALPVTDILAVLAGLDRKYTAIGMVEGATLGAVPAAALPSMVTVTTLGFRAINEYAAYFGEDITAQPQARDFARVVMGVAVAPTRETRQRLLDHAAAMTHADPDAINRDVAVAQLSTLASAAVARLLGGQKPDDSTRLGGLLSATHNQAFLRDVCEAARWMYTERALLRRHGPAVLRDDAAAT